MSPNFNRPVRPATIFVTFVLAITFLLSSTFVLAQTTVATGSIQGNVTDPSGAVVSGAKVTITDKSRGSVINTTTNSSGSYASGALVPGEYVVRVEAPGFKATQLPLNVQVNNTANGNLSLQVGQTSETIEVEASSVQVNTEQAEVQGVLNSQQIENLPVNGRNFLDLAQLEPGVQIQDGTNFDPTKVGYSSISFGGRFGRTARINVDGVDVSDETVGTTTEDIPASAIEEFSIAQSNLDLSNDLTSSGAVNVVTKSGSNSFHGEAFGLYRDSTVGSAALPTPPGLPVPSWQQSQEGANFGGPIIKDKLFFFGDGERTLKHLGAPVLYGSPFSSFSGFFPAPFHDDELLGRLDYQLTKTARLFYRFSYFQNATDATFFSSSFSVYENKDYTRNHVVGLDFNTGSFTHAIRFSYLKFQNQIVDATRGTDLPLANFPVSIAIGALATGPNYLAPQSTPQSDHQLKYDGSKSLGKHILRFGASWNHIQGGGFASFFGIDPYEVGIPGLLGCTTVSASCPAGPDGTVASNPLNYSNFETLMSNGKGFSTENPALGFPAGGLGPDNRLGFYIGDAWKIRKNITLTPGLRWVRDTGRTDSDLPAIAPLNAAYPGFGNPVRNPNENFAPQLGLAWDPMSNGKTVLRGGIGLFYDNVIFNNVLFDRPLRLQNGAFLYSPVACFNGSPQPIITPTGPLTVPNITVNGVSESACAGTIGQGATALAGLESQLQAAYPFTLTSPNGSYIGNFINSGAAFPLGLFAPNYRTPRSVQMNFGIQHEIRRGMVFTADYLRNIETHALLGIDQNHVGDVKYFNSGAALDAITAANTANGCAPGAAGVQCLISTLGGPAAASAYLGAGLGTPTDIGGVACGLPTTSGGLGRPCAFGGINPNLNTGEFLEPISRSVYNALQMKLVENVNNPMQYVKAANFQVSYSLSRFVNPLAYQGATPPGNPSSANDQDFVLQAADNDNPLKFMGPSLLDRTNQISFGGNFDVPGGFRLGLIGHFYSPLSSPTIIGNTGTLGQIFQTDFTGSGIASQPMPGTTNGSFMRQFGVNGLNAAINNYNQTQGNQPTPAGQAIVGAGLMTVPQLQALGLVAPTVPTAPPNQLPFTWLRDFDFNVKWRHTFRERFTVEPSVGIFNIFNFVNYNLPPSTMNGWLNSGANSINSVPSSSQASQVYRLGVGTGVFGLGSPREIEWGMRLTF